MRVLLSIIAFTRGLNRLSSRSVIMSTGITIRTMTDTAMSVFLVSHPATSDRIFYFTR